MPKKNKDLLPRVTVLGGGTGSFTIVSGLSPRLSDHVTSIVNMVDDGGSTGMLRDQYGALPPGDAKQVLVAMSQGTTSLFLRKLLSSRFGSGVGGNGSLTGQSLGNLIIMAATEIKGGNMTEGLKALADLFDLQGSVLPVFNEDRRLVITLANGKKIKGEHLADSTDIPSLKGCKITYDKPTVINPEAYDAIVNSDVVVIAPGSFYTSIAPVLAVKGMKEALKKAPVVLMFTNLINRDRHTLGFTVTDFADEAERIIGAPVLDYVIFNTQKPDAATLKRYAAENGYLVEADKDKLKQAHYKATGVRLLSPDAVEADPNDSLAHARALVRHDPLESARIVISTAWANLGK